MQAASGMEHLRSPPRHAPLAFFVGVRRGVEPLAHCPRVFRKRAKKLISASEVYVQDHLKDPNHGKN